MADVQLRNNNNSGDTMFNFNAVKRVLLTGAEKRLVGRLKYQYADTEMALSSERSMRRIISKNKPFQTEGDTNPSFPHLLEKVYEVPVYEVFPKSR